MRPGQNRRMRGRNNNNRKGPNPLTRSYESNGPDNIKVRGTAQTVAEKYVQLARDAQASSDPVMAENYLQHAEHYFRLIATAQEQMRQQFGYQGASGDDEFEGGEDGEANGFAYAAGGQDMNGAGAEFDGTGPQPYIERSDASRHEENGFDRSQGRFERYGRRQEGRHEGRHEGRADGRQDGGRFEGRGGRDRFERGPRPERRDDYDRSERSPERQEFRGERPDRRERFEQRRDRFERQDRPERDRPERDRPDAPAFQERAERPERPERPERAEKPADRQERFERSPRPGRPPSRRPVVQDEEGESALPAFLTNPVRPVEPVAPVVEVPVVAAAEEPVEEAPRPRRRRTTKAKVYNGTGEGDAGNEAASAE